MSERTAAWPGIPATARPPLRARDADLRVRPIGEVMGAEIENVDLSAPLADDAFRRILEAFIAHKLLVFRNQRLSAAGIRAFAERFGPIEGHNVKGQDGKVLDAVHAVTNLGADGKPSTKPHINANYYWHSDKAHYPVPSLLTMLYAVELPPSGGETEFANMAMAYAALPDAKKRRLEGLRVENDFQYAMQNVGKVLAKGEWVPSVTHPLVRIHPDTGAPSLFVGMYSKGVVGMPAAEGQALIRELLDHATQAAFTFRHHWQVGDLVVWDNRCLNHRAVMNYEMTQYRRVLLRCVVKGAPER